MTQVRPFSRSDREQLTRLINAHIAALVPGFSLPTAAILSQLEREPGEYIVDAWVTQRSSLVGVESDRIVAAAHLRRYAGDVQVSETYRNAGEIAWFLYWPGHPEAGRTVLAAALRQLDEWKVRVAYADGALPITAAYGVSDAWPHIAERLLEAGFDDSDGQVEIQLAGQVHQIDEPGAAPVPGLTVQRSLGTLGTQFQAVLEGDAVGVFEVDDDLSRGGSMSRLTGWADVCNHWVSDGQRGLGIGSWLVRHAAAWLRLGGTNTLMTYVIEDEQGAASIRYWSRFGLRPINRTRRGWVRHLESG